MRIEFIQKEPRRVVDSWCEAPHVPRVGETVLLSSKHYTVTSVCWLDHECVGVYVRPWKH